MWFELYTTASLVYTHWCPGIRNITFTGTTYMINICTVSQSDLPINPL